MKIILDLGRIRVDVPLVPNYLRSAEWHGVDTFTDDELRAVAEAWTQALLQNAHARRERRPKGQRFDMHASDCFRSGTK